MPHNHALNDEQLKELLKPFNHNIVTHRESDSQRIVPHDYVRGRLSEIFGPLGWSEQTLELTEVPAGDAVKFKYVAYRARVRVTIHPHGTPVAYWDGAGAWGAGRDLREAAPMTIWELHSDCMNGALSVAFLRATKNLGNQFGLCLYGPDPEHPGYTVRKFLSHPAPPEDEDVEQPQLDLPQYTEDPDQEREHAAH